MSIAGRDQHGGKPERRIETRDQERAEFVRHEFGADIDDPAAYHLVINTGLVSLAHAAFFGIGAYTTGILAREYAIPAPVVVLAAMALAGVVSLGASLPALRLRDDYFVLGTFGLQLVATSIANNWSGLTGGPLGLPGIPVPTICGWALCRPWMFAVAACIGAACVFGVVARITTSPMGRVMRAIREDQTLAEAFGKNVTAVKVMVFAVSSMCASLAGCAYAYYMTYIDPTSFTVTESLLVLSMIIVGGLGSLWGPFIGAAALVALPEAMRFVGLPSSVAADLRQVGYGALLVLMIIVRPRGLVGCYALGR